MDDDRAVAFGGQLEGRSCDQAPEAGAEGIVFHHDLEPVGRRNGVLRHLKLGDVVLLRASRTALNPNKGFLGRTGAICQQKKDESAQCRRRDLKTVAFLLSRK